MARVRTSPRLIQILRALRRLLAGVSLDTARKIEALSQRAIDDLERQLKALAPGRFTTTELTGKLVQVKAIQRVVAARFGAGMGNVLTAEGKVSSRVAHANLVAQLTETSRLYGIRPVKLGEAVGTLSPGLLEHYKASRDRYGAEAIANMRGSMSQSILQGESLAQSWERMAERIEISANRAETIARTETSLAGHRSELDDMIQLKKDGDPFRKQLVTFFDNRTGADSVKVHGQTRELGEMFHSPDLGIDFLHPPDRPRDRGTMIFIPKRI